MSQHMTVHNGTLHISIEMAGRLGEIAEEKSPNAVASVLRNHTDMSVEESRDAAQVVAADPGKTSYTVS